MKRGSAFSGVQKLVLRRGDFINERKFIQMTGVSPKEICQIVSSGNATGEGDQGAATRILRIEHKVYEKMMQNFSEKAMQEAQNFLYETVPLLPNYTLTQRERLKLYFLKKEYFPNDTLLQQDSWAVHAYIIVKGEVQLIRRRTHARQGRGVDVSSKLDILQAPKEKSQLITQEEEQKDLEQRCRSPEKHKTTKRAEEQDIKIGVLGVGSWIGEESILLERPMRYSVVASNYLEVFQISADLLSKFPKETRLELLKLSLQKKQFLRSRYEQLCEASKKIERQRPLLNATLSHIQRAYPQAGEAAVRTFQKSHLKISGFNHKLVLTQKNARLQNLERDPFFKRRISLSSEDKQRMKTLRRFFFEDKRKLAETQTQSRISKKGPSPLKLPSNISKLRGTSLASWQFYRSELHNNSQIQVKSRQLSEDRGVSEQRNSLTPTKIKAILKEKRMKLITQGNPSQQYGSTASLDMKKLVPSKGGTMLNAFTIRSRAIRTQLVPKADLRERRTPQTGSIILPRKPSFFGEIIHTPKRSPDRARRPAFEELLPSKCGKFTLASFF